MSDLTLRINAQFQDAQKAFEELANSSEETRAKMEKFADSFNTKQVDNFIDKQKLLQVSMTGTRGETAALQQSVNNYQKEIERLIRSGLEPNSEAVQRLAQEQQKLIDRIEEAKQVQQAQANLMKGAEKAFKASIAAVAAAGVAMVAATHNTARLGNQFAQTARVVGMSAETFQELDYAARQNGIPNLRYNLIRLNTEMIDVRNGTGQLTEFLQRNDKQLLGQLQNVRSNEEAFTLMMDAIDRAPDELSRAELAMAAFGRRGQEMILMANGGAEGLSELREEARRFGIISNEAAAQAEQFSTAQTRVQSALQGVKFQLTSNLMPAMTDGMNRVADFIAEFDNWEQVIVIAGKALAGLTASLGAFMVISKGKAAIKGLAVAFKALNVAMKANPIGAIAVVITAVLIPALITLWRNWDVVQTFLQQGIAGVVFAFQTAGSAIQMAWTVAFNAVRLAGVTVLDFIVGNLLRTIGSMLDAVGNLVPAARTAANAVNAIGNSIGNLREETARSSREAIQNAQDERRAAQETHRERLNNINAEAQARRADLRNRQNEIEAEYNLEVAGAEARWAAIQQIEEEGAEEVKEIVLSSLRDRLNAIALTEQQAKNEQINTIQQFLLQRAELESEDFEERLEFLRQKREYLLTSEKIQADERIAVEEAVNNAIQQIQEEQAAFEARLLKQRLQAFSQFTNGFGQLLGEMGRKSRGAAIASRVLAIAEAAINSKLAFTRALASAPWPINIAAAAGALAAGMAQKVRIVSTPIPSAETGGRFIVPNTNSVDGALMRVNQGEVAEITPRGEADRQESFNFNLIVDSQVFASITNKLARSGELNELRLAGNY